MDFELTKEQEEFQLAVRAFAQKEISPLVEEAELNQKFPTQLFSKMGELGFMCPSYPKKYGGREMGKISECILVQEVCRYGCDGIAAAFMVNMGIGSAAIYKHGNEEQKQKYLPDLIKGKTVGSFGLTEEKIGSNAGAIETTAIKDGDKYVVNGEKVYISNGPIADFTVLAAKTDPEAGHRGMSIFVVDKGTPGFTFEKMDKFCDRSIETAKLFFKDCVIPAENLIGEENKGFYYIMQSLEGGRISHSARSLGTAMAAYDDAVAYAKEREVFGQAIAKFQYNSFRLARAAMEIEAAKWLMYHAAYLYDNGKPCTKEASMAKLFASEVGQKITAEAMQLHGGSAIYADSPTNRRYRDCRLFTITEGTSEIQQIVLSRQLEIV
ncbi:acyl-CoA dehydrogenase family protein [Chloroflexota bacterium]